MLIAGIVLVVVGLADLVIAQLLARRAAAASGGLGAPEPPPISSVLRRTGPLTLVLGVVLVVVALTG